MTTVISGITPLGGYRRRRREHSELLLEFERSINTLGGRTIHGSCRWMMIHGVTLVEKRRVRERFWQRRPQHHYYASVFKDPRKDIVKRPTYLAVLGDGRVFCSNEAPRRVPADQDGLLAGELFLPAVMTPTQYVGSLRRRAQVAALTRIRKFLKKPG